MYSTQHRIVGVPPALSGNKVCGTMLRSTNWSTRRQAEGGMRLRGQYKIRDGIYPLVSIVTVVYNNARTVRRAMESVLYQDYENVEYIIVDGGSQDGTLNAIKFYEDAIDYFISEPDTGIYNAMNKGLSLAAGDFIGILNSDDWYADGVIRESIEAIRKENADFSCGNAVHVNVQGEPVGKHCVSFMDDRAFFDPSPCCHQSMLVSHSAYEKTGGYNENYNIAADLDMILRLIHGKFRCCQLDRDICFYELAGASWERQEESMREVRDVLKKYHTGLTDDEIMQFELFRWRNRIDSSVFSAALERLFSGGTLIDHRFLIKWLLTGFMGKYAEIEKQ